jgi:hypothetical protein
VKDTDIDLGKGYNPWGSHRKLKAPDTTEMLIEEETVLKLVSKHEIITLWELYEEINKGVRSCARKSASRSKLMALTVRLIREGKLTRTKSQRGLEDVGFKASKLTANSYLVLGPSYVPPMPDLNAETTDLCRPVRDVDRFSSLVEE